MMFVRTGLGARQAEIDETALTTQDEIFSTPIPPLIKVPPRPVPTVVSPEVLALREAGKSKGPSYSDYVRSGGGFVPKVKPPPFPVPAVHPPATSSAPGGGAMTPLLLSALAFFLFKGNA